MVNCMSSQSPWLTILQSQCSEWFHLSSEKQHRRMIPSVANGQRFFHLSQQQQHFCQENYLVLACTQLFHQLPLPKCPCIRGSHAYCVTALAILHVWNFSQTNFTLVFIEATIYKNWISWKFNPQNISPTKISASTVCTDCLHNNNQKH